MIFGLCDFPKGLVWSSEDEKQVTTVSDSLTVGSLLAKRPTDKKALSVATNSTGGAEPFFEADQTQSRVSGRNLAMSLVGALPKKRL